MYIYIIKKWGPRETMGPQDIKPTKKMWGGGLGNPRDPMGPREKKILKNHWAQGYHGSHQGHLSGHLSGHLWTPLLGTSVGHLCWTPLFTRLFTPLLGRRRRPRVLERWRRSHLLKTPLFMVFYPPGPPGIPWGPGKAWMYIKFCFARAPLGRIRYEKK